MILEYNHYHISEVNHLVDAKIFDAECDFNYN